MEDYMNIKKIIQKIIIALIFVAIQYNLIFAMHNLTQRNSLYKEYNIIFNEIAKYLITKVNSDEDLQLKYKRQLKERQNFIQESDSVIKNILSKLEQIFNNKEDHFNESQIASFFLCANITLISNNQYYSKCVENSFKRINRERIDLMFIHDNFYALYKYLEMMNEPIQKVEGAKCNISENIYFAYIGYLVNDKPNDAKSFEEIFNLLENAPNNKCSKFQKNGILNNLHPLRISYEIYKMLYNCKKQCIICKDK
jgi:hypothetical protein